ncbi:MAG: DUF4811 domain-containing protein [Oenococcus sp.]|uniref:DUF4811 domain-containing protein n=1 Tax=Oenococcus sp. TaxID=1979414 RepID=UPI0039EB0B24
MIFLLVIFFTAAAFVSWMLIKHAFPRWFFGLIFTGLLLASVILMTLNMSRHFGMRRSVSTQRQEIYSMAGRRLAAGILATTKNKNIGSDLDIYLYKDQAGAEKTKTSVPNAYRSVSMKGVDSNRAYKVTHTYRWHYNGALSRILFGIGHLDRVISRQEVVFQIPSQQWIQLTSDQLRRLQNLLANPAKITDAKVSMLLSASSQALLNGRSNQAARMQVAAIRELLSIAPSAADKKLAKQLSSSAAASSRAQALSSSIAASQAASVSASLAADAQAQAASAAQSQAAADSASSAQTQVSASSSAGNSSSGTTNTP